MLIWASCGAPPPQESPPPTPAPAPHTSLSTKKELKVHFIDVEQGDSILLDSGSTEVLIDGGNVTSGVAHYLQDYIDDPLEVMIATHPDDDHIGGLIDVLEAFQVKQIWLNGDTSTSKTYIDFIGKVSSESAEVKEANRGNTIMVNNLAFHILHPVKPLLEDTDSNSIVLMLNYGDTDFIFAGDANKEAEASMLAAGLITDVDILKVSGSRTACSYAFLKVILPEVAIHPKEDERHHVILPDFGAGIWLTEIHGTIIVTTDDKEYKIQTEQPRPSIGVFFGWWLLFGAMCCFAWAVLWRLIVIRFKFHEFDDKFGLQLCGIFFLLGGAIGAFYRFTQGPIDTGIWIGIGIGYILFIGLAIWLGRIMQRRR
ncbi:MAG: MBL fold metallo-hydrolase [Dehalococcoidales bacterium]